MKQLSFLILFLITGCSKEHIPTQPVQVINGGFEDGFNAWSGWRVAGGVDMSGLAQMTGVLDDKTFHNGNTSLHIVNKGLSYIPNGYGTISQRLKVKPYCDYIVKYWVKSNEGMITITADPRWSDLGYSDGNSREWKECEYSFKSQSDTVDLRFIQDRTCDLWIDDVTINEVKL